MAFAFSPFEVKEKLQAIGKDALLKEIPTYNGAAQEFYYRTLLDIERDELEVYKTKLQEEANALASRAIYKSNWAMAISFIACIISAAATIYAATIGA